MQPEQEALIGIAVCAMVSDGVIAQSEALELEDLLLAHPVLEGLDERDLRHAMARIDEAARRDGEAATLRRLAGAIPKHLRGAAFLLAADIVASDEAFEDDEGDFLHRLREGLGLSVDEAQALLERGDE